MNMEQSQVIRDLALRWMEIASLPIMKERKRLWKALKGLKAERPMILIETTSINGYFDVEHLVCHDPFLRNVERTLREAIEHYEEAGDDIVIEPYFRLGWKIQKSDYGMPIVEKRPQDTSVDQLAYTYEFPITTPDDVKNLKKRTFQVDREYTLKCQEKLEHIFGDILPVRVGNYDMFHPGPGYTPALGCYYLGISADTYKLMGNDRFVYWLYDHPDKIHEVASYLSDDRIAFYAWMEQEGLLDYNTDNQFAGPSSYGYVPDLPDVQNREQTTLKDIWTWAESQESAVISPAMYKEFYLPYISKVCSQFGMVYYGCCEAVHDRFEYIKEAIPNLRAVSVSPWSDCHRMGELLGKEYVYSRKPSPMYITGENPDWESLRRDMEETYEAAKNCNLEVIFRDVYDIDHNKETIRKWVEMTRAIMNM